MKAPTSTTRPASCAHSDSLLLTFPHMMSPVQGEPHLSPGPSSQPSHKHGTFPPKGVPVSPLVGVTSLPRFWGGALLSLLSAGPAPGLGADLLKSYISLTLSCEQFQSSLCLLMKEISFPLAGFHAPADTQVGRRAYGCYRQLLVFSS